MIAHIRYATTGAVSLENVHPFSRELWGIQWTFAHNGQVPKFDASTALEDQPLLGQKTTIDDLHYNPVGDTDSEAVFCAISKWNSKSCQLCPSCIPSCLD